MKQIKFAILGAGVLGLIAVFALPFVKIGPISMTLWELRKAPESGGIFLAIGGLAIGAVMGGLAVAAKNLLRWQAIVAIVGYGLAFIKVRDGLTADGGGIGAKLIFFMALIGLIASIVGTAKPEKA